MSNWKRLILAGTGLGLAGAVVLGTLPAEASQHLSNSLRRWFSNSL